MTIYEIAFMLGKTVSEIDELPYDELTGWIEYFSRRPYGWRDDNRAAIIALSMSDGKTKPEELFESLKVIIEESKRKAAEPPSFINKFVSRFGKDIPGA